MQFKRIQCYLTPVPSYNCFDTILDGRCVCVCVFFYLRSNVESFLKFQHIITVFNLIKLTLKSPLLNYFVFVIRSVRWIRKGILWCAYKIITRKHVNEPYEHVGLIVRRLDAISATATNVLLLTAYFSLLLL